ncbi:MAG: hypothetical protein AB7E47_08980 [Desulfovibrionaceae bacterium]
MAVTCRTLAQLDAAVAQGEVVLFLRGVALVHQTLRRRERGIHMWLASLFFMALTIASTFLTSFAAQSQLTEIITPDTIFNAGALVLFFGIALGLCCAVMAARNKLRRYKIVRRGRDWALLRQV